MVRIGNSLLRHQQVPSENLAKKLCLVVRSRRCYLPADVPSENCVLVLFLNSNSILKGKVAKQKTELCLFEAVTPTKVVGLHLLSPSCCHLGHPTSCASCVYYIAIVHLAPVLNSPLPYC